MAARCFVCGGKKAAGIHSRVHPEHHDYQDSSPAGLQGKSEGRRNYERSQAHAKAYEHVEGQCVFAAGGAPLPCAGPITPGHIVGRSVTGDLEVSDRYPVVPQCARHNRDVDANAELREWAQSNQFMWHDGRLWFYRYNDVMYRTLLKGEVTA